MNKHIVSHFICLPFAFAALNASHEMLRVLLHCNPFLWSWCWPSFCSINVWNTATAKLVIFFLDRWNLFVYIISKWFSICWINDFIANKLFTFGVCHFVRFEFSVCVTVCNAIISQIRASWESMLSMKNTWGSERGSLERKEGKYYAHRWMCGAAFTNANTHKWLLITGEKTAFLPQKHRFKNRLADDSANKWAFSLKM